MFKKKQKQAEPLPFNEAAFDFKLKGEPTNCSILEACATMKIGKDKGMPLPLTCTWYRSTSEEEFVVIEGVSGGFYQTNADDIGCKIWVHAVPVSEVEEYTGMPAFCEIGPIQMNETVQQAVYELVAQDKAMFSLQHKSTESILEIEDGSLTVSADTVYTCSFDGSFPKVSIHHRTNNMFTLHFADRTIDLVADKAFTRDVITILIRTLCGKLIVKSTDAYMQMQTLSGNLHALNKKHELLQSSVHSLEESIGKRQEILKDLSQKKGTLSEENKKVQTDIHELKAKIKNLQEEQQVLKEDAIAYKLENTKLENECKELLMDSRQGQFESILCEHCRDASSQSSKTSSAFSQDLSEIYMMKIGRLEDKIKEAELANHETARMLQEQIHRGEAEINFYRRKADSLAIENERLAKKEPSFKSQVQKAREEIHNERLKLVEQVEIARAKADDFAKLIEINKKKIDDENSERFELMKALEHEKGTGNIQFHGIINSLTMAIAEKEEELKRQKDIHSEIVLKING